MKKLLALTMTLLCAAVFGGPQSFDNIVVVDGAMKLAPAGTIVLEDDFRAPSKVWEQIDLYENNIAINYTERGAVLSNTRGKTCDTAWGFASVPLEVPEGTRVYKLVLSVRSALDMKSVSGGGTYNNSIAWLDENGEAIGDGSKFRYAAGIEYGNATTIVGAVPRKAKKAVLRLGADAPNVHVGTPVVLEHVSLAFQKDENAGFVKEGTFIAGPFTAGNVAMTWDIEAGEGTDVAIQVATPALDGNLQFVGPDGTPNTAFSGKEKPSKLPQAVLQSTALYIKAMLKGDGKTTPKVKAIGVGKTTVNPFATSFYAKDVTTTHVAVVDGARSEALETPMRVSVTDDSFVNWSTLKITFDGKDISKEIKRDGDVFTYLPQDGKFEPGAYELVVGVVNVTGKVEYFKLAVFRGTESVPEENRVTLRDDGMTLVGGKPFFPIGIYAVCKREYNGNSYDKAFAELKENGFNFAHTYSPTIGDDGKEFFDMADKHGFKLFIRTDGLENLGKRLQYKTVLAWYIGDDTASHQTPTGLLTNHNNIKVIDPWRLTCQADGIGPFQNSRYLPFIHGTDVFLPEIYPVHQDNEKTKSTCVPQVIRDMKTFWNDVKVTNEQRQAAGKPPVVKGCWPIIQHFKGWGWERFPTERELRAMSYVSLACGAHGITWYTYGGFVRPEQNMYNYGITSSPEVWNQITKITRELSQLQDMLVERIVPAPKFTLSAGPAKDVLDNDSLTFCAKKHDGKTYLLAVNSTLNELKGSFTLEAPAAVTEWFSKTNVAPAGSKSFNVEFEPYGVKVFVIE